MQYGSPVRDEHAPAKAKTPEASDFPEIVKVPAIVIGMKSVI